MTILAALSAATLMIVLQARSGAFSGGLTAHSDEPAHFVTGLMVFDYIRTALGTNPLDFAESYYLHYPKVALGHWPPGFYVVQAAWYAVIGSGPTQAFLLQVLLASLTSAVFFHRTRRSVGAFTSFLALVVFLSLPLIQASATQIMAEMLVSLFCFLAVLTYGDFLASRSWTHALQFAAWSSLALLTKTSAAPLGLLPAAALLTLGRPDALKSPRLWLAGLLVIVGAAPFYVAVQKLGIGYPTEALDVAGVTVGASTSWWAFSAITAVAPWPVLAIAAIGAWVAMRDRLGDRRSIRSLDSQMSLAWILAMSAFVTVFPLTTEARYFVPALAPLAILFAHGTAALGAGFARFDRTRRWSRAAQAVIAILIVVGTAERPLSRLQGYGAVEASIPTAPNTVILVSSTPIGEGEMVVARLVRDRGRGEFVVRATKALAASGWWGGRVRLRFVSTDEIRAYLNQVPVKYVVLDDSARSDGGIAPHHELLDRALQETPNDFVVIGTFPLYRDYPRLEHTVKVYENRSAERRDGPVQLEVQISSGTLSTEARR